MERVLNMNNEGVEHLIAGKYSAAKTSLRTALLYLKEFHDECRRLRLERDENQICETEKIPPQTFSNLILQSRRVPDAPNKHSCSQQHYIYRNAIAAFLDLTPKNESSTQELPSSSGLTAMIVFNLSLVYHCHADRYSSSSNLTKVLRLYKKALDALKTAPWLAHKSYSDMTVLGILNNMGAVFHELDKYEEAEDCFKVLKNVFMTSKDGVVALEAGARGGMMMNVLFLDPPESARAA
mmetsp:Transcript_19654/g.29164  ORF Transcript_19654/g.29164 Transcript_19654/m.29164 type:complete len:238 (+) Transcript_19654:52-765(+)